MKVVINLSPPRGRLSVTPSWTMSTLEKAKGFPGRKRMQGKVLHFELTPGNISYARSAFPQASIVGDEHGRNNLVNGPRRAFATVYPPTDLQAASLSRATGKDKFAFFLKPGSGKTKVCLDWAVRKWCDGEIDGIFVLSYAGVHEQWILDEIPKHVHKDIPIIARAWISGKKLNQDVLKPDPNVLRILAMNYEAYAVSDKGFQAAKNFSQSGAIAAIADESQRLKSDDSQVANRAVDNREDWAVRALASGEPTPLGIQDYYKQFSFLDPAIIGCHTYTGFKGMFCRMGGFENQTVIGYQNQEYLHEKMAPYVHVGEPKINAEMVFEPSRFNLSPTTRDAYDQLKRELMVTVEQAERDEEEARRTGNRDLLEQVFYTMRSVLPLQTKLLEITCGRLTNRDGEVMELGTERIDHLKTLLSMRPTQKCVVWSVFKEDHVRQHQMLGDRSAIFNGDTPKARRREIVKEFLDPTSDLQYLLASKAAAGTGLNLHGSCFWNIYYSDNSNAGQRWQSERRTFRLGIERDVLYTDMIARSTVNVGIFNSNKRKRDVSDMSIAEFRSMMEEEELIDEEDWFLEND